MERLERTEKKPFGFTMVRLPSERERNIDCGYYNQRMDTILSTNEVHVFTPATCRLSNNSLYLDAMEQFSVKLLLLLTICLQNH